MMTFIKENLVIQIFVSILLSLGTVALFNYYNLGKLRPIQRKAWLKIFAIAVPYFFILNAFFATGYGSFFDFGDQFQSLPSYLNLFATLISIYLLFRTLKSQVDFNKKSSFENRFFKFVDYHRENVSQLKYRDPKSEKENYWEGNQVFTVIYYEVCTLLKQLKQNRETDELKVKKNLISIAYQGVFFGAGNDGKKILKKKFSGSELLDRIDFFEKTTAYAPDERYYSGHVRRLGHYFRNIFQAIEYVENQNFLTEKEKYEYITHFRAQMSVYEQAVFFFNSLSDLGASWEWSNYSKDLRNITEPEKKLLFKKLKVTKYDLVRNTLTNNGEITDGISIKDFYPLLNLQDDDEVTVSGVLPFLNHKGRICRYCFNEKYIGYENKNLELAVKAASNENEDAFDTFSCDEPDCKTTRYIKLIKKNK